MVTIPHNIFFKVILWIFFFFLCVSKLGYHHHYNYRLIMSLLVGKPIISTRDEIFLTIPVYTCNPIYCLWICLQTHSFGPLVSIRSGCGNLVSKVGVPVVGGVLVLVNRKAPFFVTTIRVLWPYQIQWGCTTNCSLARYLIGDGLFIVRTNSLWLTFSKYFLKQ